MSALRSGLLLLVCCCLSLVALLSGCASSPPPASTERLSPSVPTDADRIATALRQHTSRWKGTPYRLGGMTRSGIDCSGFATTLYRAVLGTFLPRTTREQARSGRQVDLASLQPGDLVFFRPARKERHVGVYLHDGAFAHASVSEGVTISSLETEYWQRSFWMARRIALGRVPADPESTSTTSPPPQRAGW